MEEIVILGAGVAGLSCAASLRAAGHDPLVLDRSPRPGGRCATREQAGLRFDHGAQFAKARDAEFRRYLTAGVNAGHVLPWPDLGEDCFVGAPGMRMLTTDLLPGLRTRFACAVTAVTRQAKGWRLYTANGEIDTRHLVLALPAPNILRLLGCAASNVSGAAETAVFAPAWALMLNVPQPLPLPAVLRPESSPIAWACQSAARPGSDAGPGQWVIHAGPGWSRAHLDAPQDDIKDGLMTALADLLGTIVPTPDHCILHRWRYALVEVPAGQPCVAEADGSLIAGGDWCLGGRVEAAWISGRAMARKLLNVRAA